MRLGRSAGGDCGVEQTAQLFCLRLCHSLKPFVCAFPSARGRSASLPGTRRPLPSWGGVPRRITYDNLTSAVHKVLRAHPRGARSLRGLPRALSLRQPFLPAGEGGAHEKPLVESLVGYARRNCLVPGARRGELGSAECPAAGALCGRRGAQLPARRRHWRALAAERAPLLPLQPARLCLLPHQSGAGEPARPGLLRAEPLQACRPATAGERGACAPSPGTMRSPTGSRWWPAIRACTAVTASSSTPCTTWGCSNASRGPLPWPGRSSSGRSSGRQEITGPTCKPRSRPGRNGRRGSSCASCNCTPGIRRPCWPGAREASRPGLLVGRWGGVSGPPDDPAARGGAAILPAVAATAVGAARGGHSPHRISLASMPSCRGSVHDRRTCRPGPAARRRLDAGCGCPPCWPTTPGGPGCRHSEPLPMRPTCWRCWTRNSPARRQHAAPPLAAAKFPVLKTLDQYDFALMPQLNRSSCWSWPRAATRQEGELLTGGRDRHRQDAHGDRLRRGGLPGKGTASASTPRPG